MYTKEIAMKEHLLGQREVSKLKSLAFGEFTSGLDDYEGELTIDELYAELMECRELPDGVYPWEALEYESGEFFANSIHDDYIIRLANAYKAVDDKRKLNEKREIIFRSLAIKQVFYSFPNIEDDVKFEKAYQEMDYETDCDEWVLADIYSDYSEDIGLAYDKIEEIVNIMKLGYNKVSNLDN